MQVQIKSNSRKLNHKKSQEETEFFFPNIADCGDCGYSITFEKHKSKNRVLKYYRCSDKKPDYKCNQKYLREEKLANQITSFISQIVLDDQVYEKLKQKSYQWDKKWVLDTITGELSEVMREWYPRGNSNPCCTDENRVS